jgi:Ca2+-binding RTX toxin-like protein
MAVHKIKTTLNETVLANKPNDTWLVTANGKIDTLNIGINADGPQKGREIVVAGEVYGIDWGITFGDATGKGGGKILIEKDGILGSSTGGAIRSYGNDQTVINHGTIEAINGIHSTGKRLEVVNTGTFDTSNGGIHIASGSARIVNNGDMFGEAAVYSASDAGQGRIVVINNGLIETEKTGIQLHSEGNHLIKNTGNITNGVTSGDGRDRFINDGGKVGGEVDLGGGNDTYIIDRTSVQAAESDNDGKDTVKASVDYTIGDYIEKLILTGSKNIDGSGNDQDNRLFGNSGNNKLDGDGGNDILKGAAGADVFIFSYHGGQDRIVDFHAGQDTIDLRGFNTYGIDSFADLKAAASNQNGNLLITVGSEELLIHDYSKADLDKADFLI